jgi:aryl-alcohol dehydrogenase-like predicted oxidoreductase
LTVERLVLGTAQLGMAYGIAGSGAVPSDVRASNVLQEAYELGIRSFDTAPGYGLAEQRIGRFLSEHGLHEEIALGTKLPSLARAATEHIEQQVEEAITASLRRLRADVVDNYLVHDSTDLARHGRALVEALERQREKGRTLAIGVSVYGPDELDELERHPELGVVQHPFNLLDRRLLRDQWPSRLAASGTRLQLRSVLLQGLLTLSPEALPALVRGARPSLEALAAVLERFGLSAAEAAVPLALSLEPDGVVVGVETIGQLRALVASADTPLPRELTSALEREIGDVPAEVIDPRAWISV